MCGRNANDDMKTPFLTLLATILLLGACSEDEAVDNQPSSINDNGALTGKIDTYRTGDIDSIKVVSSEDVILGVGAVDSSGSFYVNLTEERITPILPIEVYLSSAFEGSISEENAALSTLSVTCLKDGHEVGFLLKCNDTFGQLVNNGQSQTKSALYEHPGAAYSDFWYSTKPLIVRGEATIDVFFPINLGYTRERRLFGYDVSLKQGWNEVVTTFTQYTAVKPEYVYNLTVLLTIPNDLRWRFFRIETE